MLAEFRVIDTVVLETDERTNRTADHGFALTLEKALHRKLRVNRGYASIDPRYGILNADRFQIGNRAFGNDILLPQRTLSNIVFTYNALPALKRTGLFQ